MPEVIRLRIRRPARCSRREIARRVRYWNRQTAYLIRVHVPRRTSLAQITKSFSIAYLLLIIYLEDPEASRCGYELVHCPPEDRPSSILRPGSLVQRLAVHTGTDFADSARGFFSGRRSAPRFYFVLSFVPMFFSTPPRRTAVARICLARSDCVFPFNARRTVRPDTPNNFANFVFSPASTNTIVIFTTFIRTFVRLLFRNRMQI